MDVTSAMRRAATFFADREAVVHGKDRLTFAAAWERGCRMANGLIALGLKPGDRVAVLEDNSKEAADFFLGAGIANLVRVPLYPRNSREAHLHMVGHTGCRALLVGGNYAPEVADFRQQLSDLRHILVRDHGYERWLAAQSPEDPMLKIRPEDHYIIRHTGGTTGRSKGVAYTHKAWLASQPGLVLQLPARRAGRQVPARGADQPRLGLPVRADLGLGRLQRDGR